jgi:methyltransferase (TIGR00027 family)
VVFEDRLALEIVKPECEHRTELERRASPAASSMRAFIAVRSRYAEDSFAGAYARAVRQYVVLGAGLDTFAYRCPFDDVRVYEVDHPATQAWKRERLDRLGIAVPERVAYVPVDFERETLRDGLARTRFEFSQPAFLAWLGVTPYLTSEAVESTLRAIASDMAKGTEIVFDFATGPGRDPVANAARESFAARVEALGEPIRSRFYAAELTLLLRTVGFSQVEVADAEALNARYLDGRHDHLLLRSGHLVRAMNGLPEQS